jgi:hypothetical protein
VLAPRVIVLTLELLDDRAFAVTLYPAVSNVPAVTVTLLVKVFKASPRVTVIPAPLIVTPLNVLPAVISVPVPANVIVPVWV